MRPSFITVLLLFLSLAFPGHLYSQSKLPVQIEANVRFDFIGLKNHDDRKYALLHGETDFAVSAATEDLGLFAGGEMYVQAMGIFGNKASANYAGDLQVFSNIESDTRLFLYQCYYKQTFSKFVIKLGQLDMNADFLVSSWAAPMVNSSFGVIPTISLNMPVSIFSYLAPGISFKYLYSRQLIIQTAFFDGNPGNLITNPHNLKWNLGSDNGWFSITELQYRTKSDLRLGRYKAGFFYHSKYLTDPETNSSVPGNPGFYIIGDQQLTFEKNTIKNGLSMFFQVSCALAQQNLISSYYSAGLMYRGMIPAMNEDEFTVALASARLGKDLRADNPDYYNNETAIEMTYKKYLTPSFIIQPDFQYIINPGALKAYNRNVTAGLLRAIISF